MVVTGPGTKNLALTLPPDLEEGIGDWNILAGVPPPLLKVSTYLK